MAGLGWQQETGRDGFGDMKNAVAEPVRLLGDYKKWLNRKPVQLKLPEPSPEYLARHPYQNEVIKGTLKFL